MGFARNEVKTTVVGFDTLNDPTPRNLVPLRFFDRDSLNFFVTHHGRESRRVPLGMRQHPCSPKVLDVADGALLLVLQFRSAVFQAVIKFVEMCFRKRDISVETGNGRSLLLSANQLSQLQVLAMDEFAQ